MNEDDELEKLGAEVRRRRQTLEMTLPALGERAGLTGDYVGQVELGKRDPGALALLKIASGLGCHVGQLFGVAIDHKDLSAQAIEAAEMVDRLDPAERRHVLGLLRALT